MWTPLLILLAALFRAIFGWIENSFEDGQVTLPELKKLGATIFRMTIPIVGLIYGFGIAPEVAGGISILIDWIVVKIYNGLNPKSE